MKIDRKKLIADSNNPDNPNYNICALDIAQWLGVEDSVKYLHIMPDLLLACRSEYLVSEIKGCAGKTFNSVKKHMSDFVGFCYIVLINGHVFLANNLGEVVVDSDEGTGYEESIVKVYAIIRP